MSVPLHRISLKILNWILLKKIPNQQNKEKQGLSIVKHQERKKTFSKLNLNKILLKRTLSLLLLVITKL
jgi:hypothetical protein